MKNQFILLILSLVFIFCIQVDAQWVELSQLPNTVNDENFLLASGSDILCGTDDGVYISTDIGTSWTADNNGLPNNRYVDCLDLIGDKVFLGLDGGYGFYYSTDNGKNWNMINTNPSLIVNCLVSNGSDIFAGTGSGIYLSTDNGTNWNAVNNGLPDNSIVTSMAISGSNIFAEVTYQGVYISSDNGLNWTSANNGLPITIECLLANGNNIFAGTENGIYLSTDNGTNWTAMNNGFMNIPVVYSLLSFGNNIFAGGTAFSGRGIFLSTDNGTNWTAVNNGLPDATGIYSMAVMNNTLIGSTRNFGIFRRLLSEMVLTDIKNNQSNLPSNFTLQQNYPNPFNPSTTIIYEIRSESKVKLVIYNIMGEKVAELVNAFQKPGKYSVKWNAKDFACGVYIYQIKSNEFTQSKKLILLK